MKIGLIGALLNNENLGCQALTYSLINVLEKISSQIHGQFSYYVFEFEPSSSVNRKAEKVLGVTEGHIHSFDISPLFRLRRFVHHIPTGIKTYQRLMECDVFIDLTSGDSFTDIYGQYVFDSLTNVKLLLESKNKYLILGPQTYGPFNKENTSKAKKAIEQAKLVIARDHSSADYLKSFCNKEVYVTTDLAFTLPYEKKAMTSDRIRVGINISGLLLKNKTEKTDLKLAQSTDYERYLVSIIDWLLQQGNNDIFIIPHVGADGMGWAREKYGEKLKYCGPFKDPISAKNVISTMDIFLGARMHATVGAVSSGVPTIPIAYSRKFAGLFNNIGYDCVVDMTKLNTDESISRTIDYVTSRDKLLQDVVSVQSEIKKQSDSNERLLKIALEDALRKAGE